MVAERADQLIRRSIYQYRKCLDETYQNGCCKRTSQRANAPVSYPIPDILSVSLFSVMEAPFPAYRAFIMFVAVGVLTLLYFTITRTRES